MTNAGSTPLTKHRLRMKRQGLVRVEVKVAKDDAQLLKEVARALIDPGRATETRRFLQLRFSSHRGIGLKELLSAAPLGDIALERARDLGRQVDL